jgi:hypothetical protein
MTILAAKGRADAEPRIRIALAAAGLQLDDNDRTQYLLFLGQGEINAFAALIDEHWDDLAPPVATDDKKKSKKEAKAAAPDEVVKKAKKLLDGGKAVDVALFGRMLADMPEANQDAACQVAHAISTHRVEREFDYFTAVDDKGDADESGAGMIGQVEFNSATFYRYAALDAGKLLADRLDLPCVTVPTSAATSWRKSGSGTATRRPWKARCTTPCTAPNNVRTRNRSACSCIHSDTNTSSKEGCSLNSSSSSCQRG